MISSSTGFSALFNAACLVIQSTISPRGLNIDLSPTTLGAIAAVIKFGFAGGLPALVRESAAIRSATLSGGSSQGPSSGLRRRGCVPPLARVLTLHRRRMVG